MSELSLQELDAQFSELLPEREALGCWRPIHIPCHDYNPCQPYHHHHHHHCEPQPKPCQSVPEPCQPDHRVPCEGDQWQNHWGYGEQPVRDVHPIGDVHSVHDVTTSGAAGTAGNTAGAAAGAAGSAAGAAGPSWHQH